MPTESIINTTGGDTLVTTPLYVQVPWTTASSDFEWIVNMKLQFLQQLGQVHSNIQIRRKYTSKDQCSHRCREQHISHALVEKVAKFQYAQRLWQSYPVHGLVEIAGQGQHLQVAGQSHLR
jgi:hypothetical protein